MERSVAEAERTAHHGTLRAPLPSRYLAFRRSAEVCAILLLLPVLLPLSLLIGIAIRTESRGTTLFRQQRLGQGGRPFTMVKFRSMCEVDDAGRPPVTSRFDDRVTRVGRLLRSTHLDELPQLWNVMRGDMSIVGPRPEVVEMAAIYDRHLPEFWLRLQVRPGITGLAQIRGGYADTLETTRRKLRDDLDYIDNLSALLDTMILIRTVFVMLRMTGR